MLLVLLATLLEFLISAHSGALLTQLAIAMTKDLFVAVAIQFLKPHVRVLVKRIRKALKRFMNRF